jgi:hypothetical protein
MKGHKTLFISCMNVLDAFIDPNNMTNHSYNSSFVLKAISTHPLVESKSDSTNFSSQSLKRLLHHTTDLACHSIVELKTCIPQ